jgi:hypothetical protein
VQPYGVNPTLYIQADVLWKSYHQRKAETTETGACGPEHAVSSGKAVSHDNVSDNKTFCPIVCRSMTSPCMFDELISPYLKLRFTGLAQELPGSIAVIPFIGPDIL